MKNKQNIKKKSTKKKKQSIQNVIFVAVGIGLAFSAVILYTEVKKFQQEDLLEQEIINYSNKNLEKDNFPIIVKTTGDYAHVEEAIKKYYKNLSDNVKAISTSFEKDELLTVLSPNNLKNDQPEYKSSHEILKSTKEEVNDAIKNIDELCDENTIKNLIDRKMFNNSNYYYDLYLKFMYTKEDKENLLKTRENMKEVSKSFNEYLDKADELLNFLQINNNVIQYKGSFIYFSSNSKLTEYNKIVSDLQEIINRITNIGSEKESKNNSI